jgi:hypothetical protein
MPVVVVIAATAAAATAAVIVGLKACQLLQLFAPVQNKQKYEHQEYFKCCHCLAIHPV